jgi:energy-coupling factor transporter ATP-binding protein EcfA2
MLRTLRLKNFKSHADSLFELGRVTLLIGPQGTGKSSVLQALRLLKESSGKEGLSLTGACGNLEFIDLIHQRKERSLLTFGLQLSCANAPAFLAEAGRGEYEVSYEITFDNHGFREHSSTYRVGTNIWRDFKTSRARRGSKGSERLQEKNRPAVTFAPSTYTLLPFRYRVEGEDYPLHRGFNDLRLAIADFFKQFHWVPENRLITQGTYPVTGAVEGTPQSIERVVNKLAQEWDARDEVSDHLNRVLDRRINFRGAGEEIVVEVADGLDAPYPVMCEGGGLRNLVWPLSAVAGAEPGSLVAIEEPENHLHPKAQAKLCDMLVEAAKEKELQLLVTTHSEHVLFGFLLAVSEGKLPQHGLRLYSLEGDSGVTSIKPLQVDEKGSVDGGLPGFFEASLDEAEGYFRALAKGP